MLHSTHVELQTDVALGVFACLHKAIGHPEFVVKRLAAWYPSVQRDAIMMLFVCRLPSHRLDRTSRGSVCH